MTLTERNQRQYELRQRMHEAQQTVDFCKDEIARLHKEYEDQFNPIFKELGFPSLYPVDKVAQ